MTGQTGGRRWTGLLRDALPWASPGAAGAAWVTQHFFEAEAALRNISEVVFSTGMTLMVAQLVYLGGRRVIREIKLGGTVTLKWGDQHSAPQADSSGP